VDSPDCHLTYDVRLDLLTLYVPNFDLRQAVWMGPTLTVEEAMERYRRRLLFQLESIWTDVNFMQVRY
jgi:Xaa-Pro dipeptidase